MNINELIKNIEELSLSHEDVKMYHVGEYFDVATSKSSEKYPSVWFELPIQTNYLSNKKEHVASLNVLTLAKEDDISHQIEGTSFCEVIMDELLQAIKLKYMKIGISNMVGVTLRNFSDDDLVGVRVDLTFTLGRECNIKNKFNLKL